MYLDENWKGESRTSPGFLALPCRCQLSCHLCFATFPCLALPCLALPCLALPCLALPLPGCHLCLARLLCLTVTRLPSYLFSQALLPCCCRLPSLSCQTALPCFASLLDCRSKPYRNPWLICNKYNCVINHSFC